MQDFSKDKRLLNKAAFDRVFSNANKIVTSEFVILHQENIVGHARLGLALSKKKIAKACQRNRFRRVLRESFRMHILPAVDIICLARHSLKGVDNSAVYNHLEQAWDKLAFFYKK